MQTISTEYVKWGVDQSKFSSMYVGKRNRIRVNKVNYALHSVLAYYVFYYTKKTTLRETFAYGFTDSQTKKYPLQIGLKYVLIYFLLLIRLTGHNILQTFLLFLNLKSEIHNLRKHSLVWTMIYLINIPEH